jgi:hypothetical protein
MAKDRCDACDRPVRVAGGIGDMWSGGGPSGGMTLVFDDGRERFLCFDCIAAIEDTDPADGGWSANDRDRAGTNNGEHAGADDEQ